MQKIYDESQMTSAPPNMGKGSPVPDNIKGFNGGAFWITLIWAIVHKAWIPLIVWVALLIAAFFSIFQTTVALKAIIIISALLIYITLGCFGNGWAWQNREWKSIAEFHRVQRLWAIWGFLAQLLLVSLIASVIMIFSFVSKLSKEGIDYFMCDMNRKLLKEAFQGKNFNNSEAMAKAMFEHQQKAEAIAAEQVRKVGQYSTSYPKVQIKGSSVILLDILTEQFISEGNCTRKSNNCTIHIFQKDPTTNKDKLICKYYFENGGKLIEIPINAKK